MNIDPSDFRTPGQYLQALLAERQWSQSLLAVVLKTPDTTVSRLARDEKPIDAPTALVLGEVFGVQPEVFLNLQRNYDLAVARITAIPDPTRADRATLLSELPVVEMRNRGWLDFKDVREVTRVESELTRFFEVPSVGEIEVLPHAAKRTVVSGEVSAPQLAWIYRVRQIARAMVVPKYSTSALQRAVREMKDLLVSAEAVGRVPRLLAEAGVRFVVVESLSAAKIDGVCFWLDDRSPVIGMTLRYDRIDNFWFVLRHECEHVLRGDGRQSIALDAELERDRAGTGPGVEEEELAANRAAADFCVPGKMLEAFIARKAPVFTRRDIIGFSRVVKVHPGLIAGQLQNATGRYEGLGDNLIRVRNKVLTHVVHDGWGDVASTTLTYN